MGFEEHRAKAPKTVTFAIVICSSSRFKAVKQGKPFKDESGHLAERLIKSSGFKVLRRTVVPDDVDRIRKIIEELCYESDVDIVILSGGTGLSPTDVTVEAVKPMFEKDIPGFGELFRALTYRENGAIALLSRAVAGVYNGRILFAIPGSPKAVKLALKKLILPEASHMVLHARGLG